MNFAGVRAVADVLIPEFTALGFEAGFIEGAAWDRAGHLVAKHPVANASPKLLLIGHLDTVFEPDSLFQVYEDMGGGLGKGPGIADMKGGDIIILQSLQALDAIGELANMDITVIMTGDEEPGQMRGITGFSQRTTADTIEMTDHGTRGIGVAGPVVTGHVRGRTVDIGTQENRREPGDNQTAGFRAK